MLKHGREIRTKVSDFFRTSYGTVDVTSLKSIYVNLSSWVEPLEETDRWDERITRMKSKIKNTIYSELENTPFKVRTIVDLDLRTSGIKKGKKKFYEM